MVKGIISRLRLAVHCCVVVCVSRLPLPLPLPLSNCVGVPVALEGKDVLEMLLIADVLLLLISIMDCCGAKQTNTTSQTVAAIKANSRQIDAYILVSLLLLTKSSDTVVQYGWRLLTPIIMVVMLTNPLVVSCPDAKETIMLSTSVILESVLVASQQS